MTRPPCHDCDENRDHCGQCGCCGDPMRLPQTGERLAADIARDLRRFASPLMTEAADKLDGLLYQLVAAENARDQARAQLAELRAKAERLEGDFARADGERLQHHRELARLKRRSAAELVEVTRERDEARTERTWVNATRRADALAEANETLAAQVELLLRDRDEARTRECTALCRDIEQERDELLAKAVDRHTLRLAFNALAGVRNRCRYHGDDFGFLGWERGEPRCDSCKQPWRVERALGAVERAISGPVEPVTDDGNADG